jgi:hypothetical protein
MFEHFYFGTFFEFELFSCLTFFEILEIILLNIFQFGTFQI